jgi:putative flippase GtrA
MPAVENKDGPATLDLTGLLRALFNDKSSSLRTEVFRSIIVSGVSFLFDFGLLYLLTDVVHVFYLLSALISYGFGMVVNYVLSVRWAFGRRSMTNRMAEFTIFVVIGVAGMGINALILWLWQGVLGLHYLLGRIVSAIIGYIWKFVARKLALFR